jgi:plastocyanin
MTRRALPLLIVLTACALALAACGGGGSTVQISADPNGALKFEQTSVEATAGSVTIDFTNDSSLSHDVKIEGNGVSGEGTDQVTGGSTSATVDLQPGTYAFYCSVDGHRAAGMEGTLVVK